MYNFEKKKWCIKKKVMYSRQQRIVIPISECFNFSIQSRKTKCSANGDYASSHPRNTSALRNYWLTHFLNNQVYSKNITFCDQQWLPLHRYIFLPVSQADVTACLQVQTYYLLIGYDGDPDFVDHIRPSGLQKNGCIHHTDLFTCKKNKTLFLHKVRAQFLYYLCKCQWDQ